jgi:hypothetical protein
MTPRTKAFVAFFLVATTAAAQIGTATISGTVTDPSKSVVAGVSISLMHVATGTAYSAVTNSSGFYTAPGIPVGAYQVTAETPGFKKTVRTGIVLQVDDRATVDLALEVGAIAESVEVQSTASMVDASSATVGKVVDSTRIIELPLNGRNGMSLVELTPNTRSNSAAPAGFADRGFAVSAFSVNGGPSGTNELIVDGTTNVNLRQGDVNANLNADSIQEFKVQSGVMSAEYNFTLGGVVNMVTKSGANSVHGTLYEFLRNNALDARDFFAVTKAPYKYNQYGGTIGGPIKKNKLFYFGNYEEYRYHKAATSIGTTPTAAERNGDFSGFKTATGGVVQMYDPATTAVAGTGYSRTPFVGNIIPKTRLDPVAVNTMTYFPLPNTTPSNTFTGANNYITNVPGIQSQRQELVKIDYTLSGKDTLSSRYILSDSKNDNAGTSIFPDPVSHDRIDDYGNRNFNISETHIFSSTLINQVSVGLLRNYFPFKALSVGAHVARKIGLPDIVPDITLPVFSGLTPFPTWGGGPQTNGLIGMITGQFRDGLTWIKGSHTLKMGFEYRLNRYFDDECQSCTCACVFSAGLTGNPNTPSGTGTGLASFLLGDVVNASVFVNAGATMVNYVYGFYLQDDWKVNRRLTVNTGLRWDYQQVPWETHNGLTTFNPHIINSDNKLQGALQYEGSQSGGFGKYLLNPDYKNWAPRIGFALDVFGTGRTILRGGYGIYYAYTFPLADAFGSQGFKQNQTTWVPPGNNANFPTFLLHNGYPTPPVQPIGAALGPSGFLGSSVTFDEPNGRTPYIQQFSFTLQHQLPHGWLIDAGFSGSKGTHLRAGSYDLNQLDPKYLSLGNALNNQVPNPYAGIIPGPLGGPTVTLMQSLRPYPYYNQIVVQDAHLGSSVYDAMILSLEKRLASGFVLLSSYTFSKSISNGVAGSANNAGTLQVAAPASQTSPGLVYQNGKFDLRSSRAIDSDDTPYRFVTSLVYELPFGTAKRWKPSNSVLNTVVSGWQLNTVLSLEGGLPLLISGANNFLASRPNSTGVSAKVDNPTIDHWFNTAAFVNPPNWAFGNVGLTLPDVRSNGVDNFDFSVSKMTAIHERWKVQLRGEAFNALNHANFLPPNTTFVPGTNGLNSSSTFGTVTSDRGPRIIQVAMKVIF